MTRLALIERRLDEVEKHATDTQYGIVKISDSETVTEINGNALPTREKNATVEGTLANKIEKLKSALKIKSILSDCVFEFGLGNGSNLYIIPDLRFMFGYYYTTSAVPNGSVIIKFPEYLRTHAGIICGIGLENGEKPMTIGVLSNTDGLYSSHGINRAAISPVYIIVASY